MLFVSYRLLVLFGESLVIFIINDIVRRWRGLSCFLGVSVGAPWKWDKACRRQRVDHFRGTLHWHTGTEPLEPTPRFPSCSQTCARATSPQLLCDPFRERQVFVCCVWNFAIFFLIYPNTRFCICDLSLCRIDSEAKCNTSFPLLWYDIDRLCVKVFARLLITVKGCHHHTNHAVCRLTMTKKNSSKCSKRRGAGSKAFWTILKKLHNWYSGGCYCCHHADLAIFDLT